MTEKITSGQRKQLKRFLEDGFDGLVLTKDGAQRVIAQGGVLQARLKELVLQLAAEFYVLLSDEEAITWLVEYAKKPETESRQIVNGFRQKARQMGVADTVNIHAEVLSGCLFKRDIPQMGPCVEDFQHLQNWDFPDPLTEHALLSWIPVPLAGSAKKNVLEQTALVAAFKTEANLPIWHEVSFGTANHVAGLALAHYKAASKDPFSGLTVRTNTGDAGGYRLMLYWGGGRLRCGYWHWDDNRSPDLAVFAVGVVKALGR